MQCWIWLGASCLSSYGERKDEEHFWKKEKGYNNNKTKSHYLNNIIETMQITFSRLVYNKSKVEPLRSPCLRASRGLCLAAPAQGGRHLCSYI